MATSSSVVAGAVANASILVVSASSTSDHSQIFREIACAALAAVFTITWLHPVDVIKTRIQITNTYEKHGGSSSNDSSTSYASLIKSVAATEGWYSFYRGITVAWIAEAVYYGLQLGLYEPLKTSLGTNNKNNSVDIASKLLAGAFAGLFGAITGTPFVILRTRMVANDGKRRNIASFVQDVVHDDGVLGFYKGFTAMFVRAIVLSATKMVTYDACKSIVRHKLSLDGVALQVLSAFVAGFFITATVMPFDMIRTRMMLPPGKAGHQRDQINFVQCAKNIYHQDGLDGFYRGAYAFFARIAPKTCLQFIAFEYLKSSKYFGFNSDYVDRA